MGTLFQLEQCGGPFVCVGDDSLDATLSFSSQGITQDSAGQVRQGFAHKSTITGELHGAPGAYPRYIQGIISEVNYEFTVQGNPDVIKGNRTFVCGAEVEITSIVRYGTAQAEIGLTFVR